MTEWFCGFETGNPGDDFFSGTNFTISTSTPNYGNFCGTKTYSGTATGQANPGVATNSLPYGATVTWSTLPISLSCALRINTRPTASGSEELITFQGAQIHIDAAGVISIWAGFPTPTRRATGTTVLTVGSWYTLELCLFNSTTFKARVYQVGHTPGADEFTYTATMSSTGFSFGKGTDYDGIGYSASFDDIWIRDGASGATDYIGPCQVYLRVGNDNPPIYDAFSKVGAGPNAADCWNETPSNPATACQSNAAGDVRQSMTQDPLFPIGSTATINAVKTTVIGSNTQTDTLSEMHLVGPTGSIVEYDTPIALQFSPYWSVMWSPVPSLTLINSSQHGVWRHSGSANVTTIYECHLQVCFSNLVIPTPPPYIGLGPGGGPIEFVIM